MFLKTIIFLLLTFQLYATPNWFNTNKYISSERTFYGYGVGRSEKEARANALREISEQISSNVSSSINLQTSSTNEYISQSIDSSTFIYSKQILKDTKIVKKQRENNKIYILMKHIYNTPFWYESRSFEAPLFSIVGYGVAEDMNRAIMNARSDISAQISSNISSSTTIVNTQINNVINIDIKDKISSSSSSIIKKSKIIKSEKIGNKYFIALIHKKVPKLKCTQKQNKFLENIELIKKANRLTPCKYNYGLVRMNSKWHLYSDGFSQELNYSQFDSFFTSVSSQKIKLSSEYSSYQADDIFSLEILSKESGYLNIIAVYENGKVGVMLENRPIYKNKIQNFPSKQDNFDLVAGLNKSNQSTKDLYFAFLSKEKLNLSRFETISNKLLSEKEYRFNEVIKLCKNHLFSTTLIRTTPKQRIKRFNNIKKIKESSYSWFFNDSLESAIEDLAQQKTDPKKWAFIISIEDYEFSDSVKYAKNSGRIFKLLLNKKFGIEKNHMFFLNEKKATAKNISQTLTTIASKVKKGDTIYFYFVGQGLPVPTQNNEPYILAYDKSVASISKEKTLKLTNIYKKLDSSNASKIFVFLDTTFSGATDGVSIFKGVAAPKLKPKKVKLNKKKMSIFIAGKNTQFSNKYSAKRHRMFSYFLVDGIVNQNIQEVEYLYKHIKTNVNRESFKLGDDYIQTPNFRGNKNFKL